MPYGLKCIVDALSSSEMLKDLNFVLGMAFLYGMLWTVNQVLQWVKSLMYIPLVSRCDAASQTLLYLQLIDMKYEKTCSFEQGEIYSRLTRCSAAFSALSLAFLWGILPVTLQVCLGSFLIFNISGFNLGVITLISLIILIGVSLYLSTKTKDSHQKSFEAQNIFATHFHEKLTSLAEIKTNSSPQKERKLVDEVASSYINKTISGSRGVSFLLIFQAAISGFVFSLLHIIGACYVYIGYITIGDFMLMSGSVVSLVSPLDAMAVMFSDLKKNHLSLKEGIEILEEEIDENVIINVNDTCCPLEIINYRSSSSSALVNLKVDKGQCMLIKGTTGNGKSTLMKSIVGLNKNFSGEIKIFGISNKNISPLSICKTFAFVGQDSKIFSGTIKENILYGVSRNISDEEIIYVLNALRLLTIAGGETLNYYVGLKGSKLSGGEIRRLAIARAIVRNLPVLILDEPTTGLDNLTEDSVMSYILSLGKTIIMVSHSDNIRKYATHIYTLASNAVDSEAVHMR